MWWMVCAAIAAEPSAEEESPTRLVELAAGLEESSYFRWSTELASEIEGLRLLVQPSGGSGDNVQQVSMARVDVGLVQSDVAWHAWTGSGRSIDEPELVALGVVYDELVHLVVGAESDIQSVEDLAGRRVDVGAVGSGTLYNGLDVLGEVPAELVFNGRVPVARVAKGTVAAAFNTSRAPWQSLLDNPGARLLPIDSAGLQGAPYYHVEPLPEAYGAGDGIYVSALLVARADLEDEVVRALLEAADMRLEGVTIPMHPAAEAWFGERGMRAPDPVVDYEPRPLPTLPPARSAPESDLPEELLAVEEIVQLALRENPAVKVAALSQAAADTSLRAVYQTWVPWLTAEGGWSGSGEELLWSDGATLSVLTPLGTSITGALGRVVDNLVGGSPLWFGEVGLDITQPLLDGGGLDANLADLRRGRIDAAIAALDTEVAANDLVAGVITRYWELSERFARVALRRDQVDFARRHLNRVQAELELDDAEPLAVQEARFSLLTAENALLGEEQGLRDAEDTLLDDIQARFSFHLVPLGDVVERAMDALPADDSVQRRVLTAELRRPSLRQQALNLARARVDELQTRNGALPDLAASVGVDSLDVDGGSYAGSYVRPFTDGQPGWNAGLSVALPLGRGADPMTHDIAEYVVQQAEIALDDALEINRREVRIAWRAAQTRRAQLEVALAARDIASRRHALALEAFREGGTDSFKVLTYQNDYLDARLAVVAAATDYLQAVVELDRVTGTIVDPYRDAFDAVVAAP